MTTINTATHFCIFPGCEGPCCLDCAAAVGGERRELRRGEAGYGEPCSSCVEMAQDAELEEQQSAEEQRAQDEEAERQRSKFEAEDEARSARFEEWFCARMAHSRE